jgi:hypothetical protein
MSKAKTQPFRFVLIRSEWFYCRRYSSKCLASLKNAMKSGSWNIYGTQ